MLYGSLSNETDAYRKVREELLQAEIALRDQQERVAELRRQLPLGTPVADYILDAGPADPASDGPSTKVRLSELFLNPSEPLVVEQYMFGGAQKRPCPMCTLWADGFNGIGQHLQRRLNFAIVAEAGIQDLREWAGHRGWRNLRMVSSAGSSFKRDTGFADASGAQFPGLSVFVRSAGGSVRHFYSTCASMTADINRGMDLMTPFWNLLDLTPHGRGEWAPKLEYTVAHAT